MLIHNALTCVYLNSFNVILPVYIPGWNVSNKTTAVLEFLLKLCTIDSCKENFAFNEHISWWQVYNPLQTDVFVV